jgi:hypothetical protein
MATLQRIEHSSPSERPLECNNRMPIYGFHLDVPFERHVVTERIQSVVREEPPLRQWFSSREPVGVPFIGCVRDESFKLRRDIRYRNSFLPRLRGRIVPTPTGTRVSVTMFLHPFVALFMVFWLGGVGYGALTDTSFRLVLWGMFAFGVLLATGGFFPEAFTAKRILSEALLEPKEASMQLTGLGKRD